MTLEKELLDFTNWLYDNNWKLVGNGMCLNTETKELKSVDTLASRSVSFRNYYPQDFKVGDKVRVVDSDDEGIVEIKEIVYSKFDEEYEYWYVDEDGDEVFGFSNEFEKID